MVRERELERGNPNRATLAAAKKKACYLLFVELRKQDFVPCREVFSYFGSVKYLLKNEKHQDSSIHRLLGPAEAD